MEKKVKILSDGVEMIYSGRICCFNDKQLELKIKLTDRKEDELVIRFVFNYSSNQKPTLRMNANPSVGIIIELTNCGSPLGMGLKRPLRIAELNGKNIFLIFNIYKNDESNPILDFSLYMEIDDAK